MNKPVLYGLVIVAAALAAMFVFSGDSSKNPSPETPQGQEAMESGRTPGDQRVRADSTESLKEGAGEKQRKKGDKKAEVKPGSGRGGGGGTGGFSKGSSSKGQTLEISETGKNIPVFVENKKKGDLSAETLKAELPKVSVPLRGRRQVGWEVGEVLKSLGIQQVQSAVFHGTEGEKKRVDFEAAARDGSTYVLAYGPSGKLRLFSSPAVEPFNPADRVGGSRDRARSKEGSKSLVEIRDIVRIEVNG